jgi:DNA-binding transcriptional ArsR family regulator
LETVNHFTVYAYTSTVDERPPPGAIPRRTATREQAAALASAVRLRILRMAYFQPLTNREIADRLGRDPATTLHHVRKLVDNGFLEALPARRGTRGAREIPYRATGLSWSLNPPEEGEPVGGSEAMLEAFLGEIGEVGVERLSQMRLALQLDDAQVEEFRERLAALLNEYAARPVDPDAAGLAVYVAVHPAPEF